MSKLKNNFREWYQPHESFVVRNPLFSMELFYKWKGSSKDQSSSKEELTKQLREFYLQPVAQEALYIASPDLHQQLLLWLENKIEKADKKEKTEMSLVKYMIRMCTRCTPYGLFASCTHGIFAGNTGIQLADKNNVLRYGRLDMDYVCEVHAHLLKKKEICDQLLFFPNTSLYQFGEQLRYIEHRFREKTGRSYHLVQIELSDYLEKIFLSAKTGSTPVELAASITGEDISPEEAGEFIYELISNQVLVSEIEPNVTGDEYFSILLKKLKNLSHTEKYIYQFEKIFEEFKIIKEQGIESKYKNYIRIRAYLEELEIPVHLKTLIQVDTYRPSTVCSINKKVQAEVLQGASLLQLLTADRQVKDSFTDFKSAFRNRYESQWIPLAEVLDTESGIGYGKFSTIGMEESPLIDKLPIGNGQAAASQQVPVAEKYKWQLYQEALTKNKNEVIIDDQTIDQLLKNEIVASGLPDSICMMMKLHAGSAEDIDNGKYQVTIQSPSGPSGGNLLGRFCHLHPEIEKLTKNILQSEEAHRSDCVYAEIAHLPESRIGNILMRPVLRKYEIPYLCGTTLNDEFQIPVNDLLVGIEGDRVILRSQRLNKRVIPRMTTAHNFNMTTLPVYQFLCDLQYQHVAQIGWHWGVLDSMPFLPRVKYDKFIVSKARWILSKEEIKDCEKKDGEDLIRNFSLVVKKRNIPEYVLLSQGDNELLLHLENIFCIKLLLSEVNKSSSVILTETLDTPEQCWIKSPGGTHSNEFLMAFSKKIVQPVEATTIPVFNERPIAERNFPVGSEWLYAKIYCGTKTAEKILCEVIKPYTEVLLADKIIDRFFFIRYYDEGHHIRVRFHNDERTDFWKEVISGLQELIQPYIDNHSVHNIQYESYQREIERYGADTMEPGENLFYYQSVSILNFISMLDGDEGEQYRWQIALKAIDIILDDFNYTTLQKRDLVKMLNTNFADEFKVGAPEQKKISERFSNSRKIIQTVMNNGWEEDENLRSGISAFIIDDPGYRKTIEDILNSKSVKHNTGEVNRLMSGYLHMFINRMFVGSSRKVELVIYDYLLKIYESRIAMTKNKKVTEVSEDIDLLK